MRSVALVAILSCLSAAPVQAQPSSDAAARRAFARAEANLARKRFADAARDYRAALDHLGASANLRVTPRLVEALRALKRYHEAAEELERLLATEPNPEFVVVDQMRQAQRELEKVLRRHDAMLARIDERPADLDLIKSFLARYPHSPARAELLAKRIPRARALIAEKRAWTKLDKKDRPQLETFLERYPNGEHAGDAAELIAKALDAELAAAEAKGALALRELAAANAGTPLERRALKRSDELIAEELAGARYNEYFLRRFIDRYDGISPLVSEARAALAKARARREAFESGERSSRRKYKLTLWASLAPALVAGGVWAVQPGDESTWVTAGLASSLTTLGVLGTGLVFRAQHQDRYQRNEREGNQRRRYKATLWSSLIPAAAAAAIWIVRPGERRSWVSSGITTSALSVGLLSTGLILRSNFYDRFGDRIERRKRDEERRREQKKRSQRRQRRSRRSRRPPRVEPLKKPGMSRRSRKMLYWGLSASAGAAVFWLVRPGSEQLWVTGGVLLSIPGAGLTITSLILRSHDRKKHRYSLAPAPAPVIAPMVTRGGAGVVTRWSF